MEPAPPDSKRQRLASWSSTPSTSQAVSLPRPHSTVANPLPPPRATAGHNHNHNNHNHGHSHPPPPGYPPYTSRPPDQPHSATVASPSHHQPPQHPDSERRYHEQEHYAPMQDHYQQQHHHQHQQHQHPPSPAHNHYQTSYPTRDPSAVKREPGDDLRRPNSTGHATGPSGSTPHPQPPAHHGLPPPPSYPDSRHMSYDNGHSVPPTPVGYRAPSFPPPTPIQQQATYEGHASYQAAPSDTFYSVYSSSIPAKKKNTRASQACDQCRQLKAKCDETKPCKTCRDKGLECRYRDPVPKATDKAQADILDGIAALQASLTSISNNVERMEGRLCRMEDQYPPSTSPGYPRPKDEPMMDPERLPERLPERMPDRILERMAERMHEPDLTLSRRSPYANGSDPEPYYSHHQTREMNMTSAEHHAQHIRMMADDDVEAEPGPPVPPGEPAIPINHTTLASLLLDWPSIRELTKVHIEREGIKFISEFPIRQEQNRGPLIVYGRGEDALHQSARQVEHGTVDMMDEFSEVSSPSPGADFGHLGGMSPPDNVEYKGGVLGYDGNPDFNETKVWAYVDSFRENILNMHPIVQPRMLNAWVRHFLDELPTAYTKSTKPQAVKSAFAISTTTPLSTPNEVTGSKRKRSPGPDGPDSGQGQGKGEKSGKPRRTLVNGLVLTVLALGKVCLQRDYVPDVVHAPDNQYHANTPSSRNGIPASPSQASPPSYPSHSHSTQASPHDPQERGGQSRRPSIHGGNSIRAGFNLKKNYDVIPGLEYFAYASDILGNHMGSYNNLKNVYANVFAGLYLGQLARPLESFAYIHQASHKLQILIRPSLDKLRTLKKRNEFIQETKYNQLALAFWTCLQLESDLIAELQLPPSGLLSYEDDMPHPNMSLLDGFSQRILDSYPGQLYLRTHLNSIHRMFYAPDDPTTAGQDKFQNVDLVADSVSGMNWVAPSFAFREDDPPADDILAARLRAKYWGAQTITYRPFVRQILQFSHSLNHHPSSPNPPTGTEFRNGIIAPVIHPNTKSLGDIDPAVVELAKKGINALVESTRPFHNLGDKRPIITNVFGTAHAQWGNLLVLSAAYRDPVLSSFINEDLLRNLFHRTIQFLRQSATSTSSLRIDLHILEGLQRDLFYGPDPRTTSSFSSQPSAQTPTMQHSGHPMHVHHSMSDPNMMVPHGGHR